MESTLRKYVPSISPLLIILLFDIQNHTFFHWFEWKKVLFVSLRVLFVQRFISETFFNKGYGVLLPTSVSSISIQCMVDLIRQTVLT